MTMNEYIEDFKNEDFGSAFEVFRQGTKKAIEENMAQLMENARHTFSGFFAETARAMENSSTSVGKITVSLIRTTAWEERQCARIEAYDKDEITGKLLNDMDMDITPLFSCWDSLRGSLVRLAEEKGVRRHVRDSVIRHMMESRLGEMTSYLYGLLKYFLLDADEIENFSLLRVQPGFAISVGEYQDWQKPVYIEVYPMDLADPPADHPMVFGHFEGQGYRNLNITGCSLEKSKFVKCSFAHCTFEDVNLNDVRFVECIFRDVHMKSGTMYGAMALDCETAGLDCKGMKMKWIPFDGTDREYDIYQDAIGIGNGGQT